MKVRLTADVNDNFEVGRCALCPFADVYENMQGDILAFCPLDKEDDCPIEVVEE